MRGLVGSCNALKLTTLQKRIAGRSPDLTRIAQQEEARSLP